LLGPIVLHDHDPLGDRVANQASVEMRAANYKRQTSKSGIEARTKMCTARRRESLGKTKKGAAKSNKKIRVKGEANAWKTAGAQNHATRRKEREKAHAAKER
jgi:hypothetical protein